MYNLNCYNWNDIVPKQYIWESTCGYHAIRNAIIFYRILIQIKESNGKNDYLKSIYNNQNFTILKSEKSMLDLIKKYQNITKIKGNTDSKTLLILKNRLYQNYPIQIIYDLNSIDLNFNDTEIKILILYRKRFEVSKHWIPIVIHKINNQFNLHILDSFESTWYGDLLINNLIDKIKNKYKSIQINCSSNNLNNFIKMSFTKTVDLIVLTIFLFLIIYTSYHN